jgi:hypothetical protein
MRAKKEVEKVGVVNKDDFSQKEVQEILHIIQTFVNENKVTCPESVMQMDDTNLSAPEYMADIVAVIEHRIK